MGGSSSRKTAAELRAQQSQQEAEEARAAARQAQVQAEKDKLQLQLDFQQKMEAERIANQKRSDAERERNRKAETERYEQIMRERQEEWKEQIAMHQQRAANIEENHKRLEADIERREREYEASLEQFKRDHAEKVEQQEAEMIKLKEEMAKAAYEFSDKDPEKLMQVEEDNFAKFLEGAAKFTSGIPTRQKTTIAVLGPAGVGKSTFINAWAGTEVTAVGREETTDSIQTALSTPDLDFLDVPGSHDERADFFHVDNLHQIKSLHLVVVMYTNRVGHALKCLRLLKALSVPMVLVRNMCQMTGTPEDDAIWTKTLHETEDKVSKKMDCKVPIFFLQSWPSGSPSPGQRPLGFEDAMQKINALLQRAPVDKKRRQ